MGCGSSKADVAQPGLQSLEAKKPQQLSPPAAPAVTTVQPPKDANPALEPSEETEKYCSPVKSAAPAFVSEETTVDLNDIQMSEPRSDPEASHAILSTPVSKHQICLPEQPELTPSAMSPMESPGDPMFDGLRTLRDSQNAHAGRSMDNKRLKEFVSTAFDDDEEEEEDMTRSLYLKAKQLDPNPKALDRATSLKIDPPQATPVSAPAISTATSDAGSSSPYKKPPSPAAGIDRRRVGPAISPAKRLMVPKTSISQHRAGSLDDFAMDDDAMRNGNSSSSLRVGDSSGTSSPRKTSAEPVSSSPKPLRISTPTSPAPESKRGFLVQLGQDEEVSSDRRSLSTPAKAYHVLDGGTLYQVDAVRKVAASPFGMMDNRAISLRNTSIDVHDNTIDIIAEPESAGPSSCGKRLVSFEFKNEDERAAWVDALKKHIEYSAEVMSTDE